MQVEIKNNSSILGDAINFRTVFDKTTQEFILHLAEKDGETYIWTNKMVPLKKIKETLIIIDS
jgi:hypothetical protein